MHASIKIKKAVESSIIPVFDPSGSGYQTMLEKRVSSVADPGCFIPDP
jgi:hypothetical protein